jgi:hypothetical protein
MCVVYRMKSASPVGLAMLPGSMALCATKGDENSHSPITNRLPDAIRPHMRFGQWLPSLMSGIVPQGREIRQPQEAG